MARAQATPALGAAALYYARTYGWAVFPLHSPRNNGRCSCHRPDCGNVGKHPRTEHGVDDATTDPAQIERWWAMHPDANIGIAMGRRSGVAALDIDPRNGGEDGLDTLVDTHGRLPETVQSRTGGGGDHYLFAYPADLPPDVTFRSGKVADVSGVDFKADGGYIVAPPSVHASGRPYAWEASSRPGEVPMAPCPAWLVEQRTSRPAAPQGGPSGPVESSFLFAVFQAAGMVGKRIDATRVAVTCPWAQTHTTGAAGDTSTILFAPSEGRTLGWLHCSHSHCEGRGVEDVLAAMPADAVAAAKRAGPGRPRTQATTNAEAPPEESAVHPTAPPDPNAWQANLSRSRGGAVKNTYGNLALILRHTYGPRLTYNAMRLTPLLDAAPIDDADIGRLREDLERTWDLTPSKDNTAEAVRQVAAERSFHPVKDYLTGLRWDAEQRLARVAAEVLGAEATPLTIRMLRCWFISAVARALRPGCKVDTTLVLVGPQGFYKSTFFEVLGAPHFSDTAMDISGKDGLLQLAFAWIYEWPELENVTSKKQASEVKAFTTSRTDTFRPPFARSVIQHPRSTVIVGTTNEEQFLNDATGSRRFHVIKVRREVDRALLAQWRDQLWAEAVTAFESGEHWWLDRHEDETREDAADVHQVEDATHSAVASWAGGPEALRLLASRAHGLRPGYLMTSDVLEKAFKMEPGRWDRQSQMRVGAAFKRLGWRKVRVTASGARAWGFTQYTGQEWPEEWST
jgi:hypothetical protein